MSSFIPSEYLNSPIQLKYVPENQIIVDFPNGLNGKASFPDELEISTVMKVSGVQIPEFAKKNYPNRKFVTSNEPDFGIVFYKFYYPNLPKNEFKWIKIESAS